MSRNWLITGVSSGLGRALAQAALARGDRVAGTLRKPEQAEAFEALAPGRAKALVADVTDNASVERAVAEAIAWSGGLDVVVNNAGYGLIGAFEEISAEEFDRVVATNLSGTVHVIRAVLPHLRARGAGDIVNLSSAAGIRGVPGFSAYSAAKFAVSGLSEALRGELAPFGIRVMVVEPGAFRTGFREGAAVAARIIPDYAGTPAGRPREAIRTNSVPPRGDPQKLVRNLLTVLDGDELPAHFPVGDETYGPIEQREAELRAARERYRSLATNVSLDEPFA